MDHAAVDNRVVGIIPAIIALLNLEPSFGHHYRSYGFWAPAIAEFERTGMRWTRTPQFEALIHIEDPPAGSYGRIGMTRPQRCGGCRAQQRSNALVTEE